MVFSDPTFIFLFLPICLLAYLALGGKFRLFVINLFGMLFYVWGAGIFISFILAQTAVTYLCGNLINKFQSQNSKVARLVLTFGIMLNIGGLFYFKYAGFGIEVFNSVSRSFGLGQLSAVNHLLPLGISFFTFQFISYLVDVYRRVSKPALNVKLFISYVFLFPHLIAGPIVRYAEIEKELGSSKKSRLKDTSEGFPRFFWGLSKKILIADQSANIANAIFGLPDNRITFVSAWIAAITYSIQIYFDFSGYSDMAIGLARMSGFTFPENFDRPYSSMSVTDFWRRWHITLSRWFRDYVYFPLGGNRRGNLKTYRNLWIVFVLTGVWHGANWTFLVWGLFHGGLLILERITKINEKCGNRFTVIRRIATYLLICIGWVIFRSDSVSQAFVFICSMLSPTSIQISKEVIDVLTTQHVLWTVVGLSSILLPSYINLGKWISYSESKYGDTVRLLLIGGPGVLALIYATSGTFSPFLYFNF